MNIEKTLEDLDYRQVLKNEFEFRKEKNSSYSLRSFARDLEISPSRLSEVLNGKGNLSPQLMLDIGIKLGISKEEIFAFKAALEVKNTSSEAIKKSAIQYLENYNYQARFQQLPEDTFKILADWYHFAILSAMEMDLYDGSPEFISRALRLPLPTIEQALRRMFQHNLVDYQNAKFIVTGETFTTSQDIENKALQESHKQTLDQVKICLSEVDVLLRDVTSMTICIDVDNIPEAKKMIKDFRRKLSRSLVSGKKNAVYNLNIQLHPLSEIIKDQAGKQ